MAVKRIRQQGGLVTDPSALDVPEGALRRADNVLLHRPGLIQPRPGFADTTGIAARTTDYRPIALYPFDGNIVVHAFDGTNYRLERASANVQYTGDVVPPISRARVGFAEARGSLYIATSAGIRKISSAGDTHIVSAGVPTDYVQPITFVDSALATAERHAIASGKDSAYRYCWVSEDANGYVRRSAPSARWVETSGGSNVVVQFERIYLPDGILAGNRLEIYRTEGVTSGTSPGTDYFLVLDYEVTASDFLTGYVESWTLVDDIPDERLGAALYTSSSQGGVSSSNEPPPQARSIAEWAGVMWFGNTTQRTALTVELVNVYDSSSAAFDRTGLHYSLRTGTTSSGTPTVTALSGVDGLKVGQYVTDSSSGPAVAGTRIPALTTLSSIRTLLTVTHASIVAGDTVTILGQAFTWRVSPSFDNEVAIGASSSAAATNLAAKLDGWLFAENIDLTAVANSGVVTVTDALGHGIEAAETGSGVAVTYECTLSANATGTAAGIAVRFSDSVTLNSIVFFAWSDSLGAYIGPSINGGLGQAAIPHRRFGVTEGDAERTIAQLAHAVNAYAVVQDPSYGIRAYRDSAQALDDQSGGAISFIRTAPDLGAITMQCAVRAAAWRPNLAVAKSSDDESKPGRLHWSKLQEPEAVPLLNFAPVGNTESDIVALTALQDALLVWKEDGLFRVTGAAPSSWVIDALDKSLRLLHPDAVCVLDGTAYAWTDRGVVAVTEGGVQRVVSAPIATELRERARGYGIDALIGTGTYMAGHPRIGLAILACDESASSESPETEYVFHAGTGVWAAWPRSDRHLAYDPVEERLVAALDVDAWRLHREQGGEGFGGINTCADALMSVTVTGAGTSVTAPAADFSPFSPAVGDIVFRNASTRARITSVSLNAGTYTLGLSVAIGSGSATWYQAIDTVIEWHPQHLVGLGQRWQEMHLEFVEMQSLLSSFPLAVGGYAHRDTTVSTVEDTITTAGVEAVQVTPRRIGMPRACVRTPYLVPYLRLKSAGTFFRLSHAYLHHTTTGRRTAR